nr:hypothetical protein [uncultured Rhodoferax sp.]
MANFHTFLSAAIEDADGPTLLREADSALERFTRAFNATDIAGMDAELHFPHVMYSGGDLLVWQSPGNHPEDFFDTLKATGWSETRYEKKEPVLLSKDKVHFVVIYTRRDAMGTVLSTHTNLWVVTRVAGKWGIAVRSY